MSEAGVTVGTVGDAGGARVSGAPTAHATVTVRYFAAAAEAAGSTSERLAAGTAGALRAAMVERHGPDLERVLTRCSLLADGVRLADDTTPVPAGSTVDVLPPFAGG